MKKIVLGRAVLVFGVGLALANLSRAEESPFKEGEDLRFAIRWGKITGGYSSLSIEAIDQVAGRPAYHIVSEARSTGLVDAFYKVRDRNEAWLDTEIPQSLRYEKNIHEGKYRVHEVVTLDQAEHRFVQKEVRLDKNTTEEKQGSIPPNVLDVLGSLYVVRTLPLEVGKSFTIDVHSGDKSWPLLVKVTKRERVKVKAGKFDCYRVEPVLREPGIFMSKGKKLEVWITADARRMPVLMRSEIFIGHVSAELVRHQIRPPKDALQLTATPSPRPLAY